MPDFTVKMRILILLIAALIAVSSISGHAGEESSESTPTTLPSKSEIHDVCLYVASKGPSIAPEVISEGKIDANNDGQEDYITILPGNGGTETLQYSPTDAAESASPIEYTPDAPENLGGIALFRHEGRTYTLNFESQRHIYGYYLGFIDASNNEHFLCRFANSDHETLTVTGPHPDAKLCNAVLKNQVHIVADDGAALSISEAPDQLKIGDAPSLEKQITDRPQTSINSEFVVDFRNTGHSEKVALLTRLGDYMTEFSYFDEIRAGQITNTGKSHDLLVSLQQIDFNDPYFRHLPISNLPMTENSPSWFEFEEKIYFDNRVSGENPFHEVMEVEDTRIDAKCIGTFETKWEIDQTQTQLERMGKTNSAD